MAPTSPPTTLSELVDLLLSFINLLIPLLITLTSLVIVWKIVDAWVIHAGDEVKRGEGKVTALTGVVVIVIMLCIWGIIALLRSSIF